MDKEKREKTKDGHNKKREVQDILSTTNREN